ncbi:DsbA family protein [Nocardia asteroides]|uniref:DsbA family protein n=1 Tax=Nocardia asteroides TaxID=1824 RepID=UPI001E5525E0|nr:thioredoxin domain-containing protein [Nocardia asteroides]UGT53323.1 DsbA family protein [Nocardia asteroides]
MTAPIVSRRIRIVVTIAAVLAVGVAALIFAAARDDGPARTTTTVSEPVLVRPDSHRLATAPDGRVTLVEFLDFECEACRAMFPAVERLREQYRDRVTFVVRYFPLPGHFNSERAARAVEAAAAQGRFEQMYQHMFDTQAQWGEQRKPLDSVFRGFAADLGLDLAAFDAVYNDPATAARVLADFDEGLALGVQGTPTFFVNGIKIGVGGYDDLAAALDSALA